MNADGTDQRRLTSGFGLVNSPGWSVDGKWILFNADRSGNFDLYLMPLEGQVIYQLTKDPTDDFNAVWQP